MAIINLPRSLGFRNNRALQEGLYQCSRELFGHDRQEFEARWRPKRASDKGTLRQYMQPTAEALFDEWKRRRDPAWLYSHPEYKWDSIGVSVCQSKDTTAGGIKLLQAQDADPASIFDWGAGPGFTSLMLAANFPDAMVHYNEINPELVEVFEWFRDRSRLTNVEHVLEPEGLYDVIQAYEISEHFVHTERPGVGDPITETVKVLEHAEPYAYFMHSSCWSAENRWFTLGHFLSYDIDGRICPNTRVQSHFRDAMGRRGWKVLGAGWNSRPFLFQQVE